ncbi:NUDIX domain-containing protein [Streptomyces sp. SID2563]|nr:NUDIX domain-containing protein [Streptomyces sp. SID2563]
MAAPVVLVLPATRRPFTYEDASVTTPEGVPAVPVRVCAVAGLARELREELGLDVAALPEPPRLLRVQDQSTTRPGRPGTFRRLHLIHLLAVPREVRAAFPAVELDAEDGTRVVWVPLAEAAGLHLYPAAGPVLLDAAGPDVLLPPLTDLTYAWR